MDAWKKLGSPSTSLSNSAALVEEVAKIIATAPLDLTEIMNEPPVYHNLPPGIGM